MGKGNTLNVIGRELPRGTWMRIVDTEDPLREFVVTVPELERLVKRSTGRTIFLRAGWFARSIEQHDAPAGKYRGYDITGNVEVPKRVALKFLKDAYSEHMRNVVFARITFSSTCLFIGG